MGSGMEGMLYNTDRDGNPSTMKDFWVWATAHPFLTFFLGWSALAAVGKFFGIFHRTPQVNFSDEQIQTLGQHLANRPLERTNRIEVSVEPPPRRKAPTWYERLSK